jgi:hypothetical protein
MKLVQRLIAGAMFGSSLVCAADVKAQVGVSIDYHIGYYLGAVHTACSLYDEGFISKTAVKAFIDYLMKGDDDIPGKATKEAFDLLATDKTVKNCPLPR